MCVLNTLEKVLCVVWRGVEYGNSRHIKNKMKIRTVTIQDILTYKLELFLCCLDHSYA